MKFAWWCYFSIVSLNVVLLPFLGRGAAESWIAFGFMGMGLLAVLGYIRRRPYLRRAFWKIYFFLFSLGCLFFAGRSSLFVSSGEEGLVWAGTLFALVLLLPMAVALWRYSFLSQDVWQHGQ